MVKPYSVTFNGHVTIYVDAYNDVDAIEKADEWLMNNGYDKFEYNNQCIEVEQEYID